MISLTFTGRLGRPAETRHTQSGDKATSFAVATDLGWGDKKKTLWIDCTIWGDRGEKLAPHLTKGQAVTIQGRPDLRTWDKDGKHGAAITCTVQELELMGGKKDDQPSSSGGGGWEPPHDLDDEVPW